jgi:hypothetical protein
MNQNHPNKIATRNTSQAMYLMASFISPLWHAKQIKAMELFAAVF